MDNLARSKCQRIAEAASAYEQRRTGRAPISVSVVLGAETLVITLHGALSPAEKALSLSTAGAAELQEYRRKLIDSEAEMFRQEIKEIIGVDVRETAAEIEPKSGTVVTVFTTGTIVQVFLLANGVPTDSWTGKP